MTNEERWDIEQKLYDSLGLNIPRFRDVTWCKFDKKETKEELNEKLKSCIDTMLHDCVASGWRMKPDSFWASDITDFWYKYYSGKKDFFSDKPCHVRWNRIHGKKRKVLKYMIRKKQRAIINHWNTMNKYAGNENVLRVYARLGDRNWNYWNYDNEMNYRIAEKSWFIEKVDDTFDSTYCNIFVDIAKAKAHKVDADKVDADNEQKVEPGYYGNQNGVITSTEKK